MKLRTRLIGFLMSVCLLLSLALPVSADNIQQIIHQLLAYYRHHQEAAETDILRLLEQMRAEDPGQAENWEAVMDAWSYACSDFTVTPGVLPDGLPEDNSLCIVVMGFALNANGTMKEELIGRLETTLASAQKYPNAYILCTGGGTASGNYAATEAGRMALWLEDYGIPSQQILIEDRSYSTELNAVYSLELLQQECPQVDTLALISSDYHLRRCFWLFQSQIYLQDLEQRYTIRGNAGYEAGYIGESGLLAEAESMGNLYGLRLRYAASPALSQLTNITVSAAGDCPYGEFPDITVTAYYDTDFSRDVTGSTEILDFDPNIPGTQKITAVYTENGITASACLSVEVLPPPTEAAKEVSQPETTECTVPPLTEPQATEAPASSDSGIRSFLIPAVILLTGSACLAVVIVAFRPKQTGKYEKRG